MFLLQCPIPQPPTLRCRTFSSRRQHILWFTSTTPQSPRGTETAVGSKSPSRPLGKSSSQEKHMHKKISQKARLFQVFNTTHQEVCDTSLQLNLWGELLFWESHIHPVALSRLPKAHAKVAPIVEWPIGTPIKATAHSKAETTFVHFGLGSPLEGRSHHIAENRKH